MPRGFLACVCLLFVVLLPELLASYSLALGQNPRVGRVPFRGALRGGCDGEQGAPQGGAEDAASRTEGVGGGLLAEEMHKASELLKRVNVELGETEALVEEKKAVDANFAGLQEETEKARGELSQRTLELLLAAAKSGDVKSVHEALENSADMFATDDDGMNALHHAAAGGHTAVIEALVNRDGSALPSTAADGSSALHLASYYGCSEAVGVLLNLSACVHAQDAEG